jgi:hypothetical protein
LKMKSPQEAVVAELTAPRARLCDGFNVGQLVLQQMSSV